MEYFSKKEIDTATAQHTELSIPASAYIPGVNEPTLSKSLDCEAVIIEDRKHKILQRAVATDTFYECTSGKFDTIFITKKC